MSQSWDWLVLRRSMFRGVKRIQRPKTPQKVTGTECAKTKILTFFAHKRYQLLGQAGLGLQSVARSLHAGCPFRE